MIHAVANAIRYMVHEDGRRVLFIGADHAGRLLEVVGVVDKPDTEPRLIHAMPLRRKYYDHL